MKTHASSALVHAAAFAAAVALVPSSALAQAGLSGNALSGQELERLGRTARDSTFDNGRLQSTSALGQLEQMTGQRVDRSSSSSSGTARAVYQAARPKPRINMNQEIAGALTGALVGALFASVFDDNSAQRRAQAEAEAAARAAAQAEALRVQQELARQARLRNAQKYRAEWDAREAEVGDRLGGAFEVRTGTAFFGEAPRDAAAIAAIIGSPRSDADPVTPANPVGVPDPAGVGGATSDPIPSDPSVVDLRGSSLVVNPTRSGVITPAATAPSGSLMPRWSYEMPEVRLRRSREPSQLAGLIDYFAPKLGEWYGETVLQGTLKATAWGKLTKLRGMDRIKALHDFDEQRGEMRDDISEMYEEQMDDTFGGANRVALALGSRGNAYAEEPNLERQKQKIATKMYELTFGQIAGQSGPPDLYELKSPSIDSNFTPLSGGSSSASLHLRMSRLGLGGL